MTTDRAELRAFGVNLMLTVDALFLGSAFFAFCYRRSQATEWRAAHDVAEWTRTPSWAAIALLVLVPLVYAKGARQWIAGLLGFVAAGLLFYVCSAAPDLSLPGQDGLRAPRIAFVFFTIIFALHATVFGIFSMTTPYIRRLLFGQAAFALLVLPVVFSW
ncbi:MAG: hypothetical protein AAGD14_05700 [Planctomycetota bacterium]